MQQNEQMWQYRVYAERAWVLSTDLMLEAARLGRDGKGFAVVAHEARVMAEYLTKLTYTDQPDALEKERSALTDTARRCGLLAMNLMLETIRVSREPDCNSISKAGAVLSDEIRALAGELTTLLTGKHLIEPEQPYITTPLTTVSQPEFYSLFSIGGHIFIENTYFICEVFVDAPLTDDGKHVRLRGHEMPVIDAREQLGLVNNETAGQPRVYFALETAYKRDKRIFAVRIDCPDDTYNAFFDLHFVGVGKTVPPNADNAPLSSLLRDCWDTEDGRQLLFLDWDALADR